MSRRREPPRLSRIRLPRRNLTADFGQSHMMALGAVDRQMQSPPSAGPSTKAAVCDARSHPQVSERAQACCRLLPRLHRGSKSLCATQLLEDLPQIVVSALDILDAYVFQFLANPTPFYILPE